MDKSGFYELISGSGNTDWEPFISYRRVAKGDYIYLPPLDLHDMYEITAGVVKIGSYSPAGEEIVCDVLKPGDFFGNLHYFREGPVFREFSKALTDTSVRMYNLSFFRQIIVRDERAAEWFNRYVVSRWCRLEGRLFSISAKSPSGRISALRQEFNTRVKDAGGRQFSVYEVLSQKDIAHLAGTTRQTVAGVIKKEGAAAGA